MINQGRWPFLSHRSHWVVQTASQLTHLAASAAKPESPRQWYATYIEPPVNNPHLPSLRGGSTVPTSQRTSMATEPLDYTAQLQHHLAAQQSEQSVHHDGEECVTCPGQYISQLQLQQHPQVQQSWSFSHPNTSFIIYHQQLMKSFTYSLNMTHLISLNQPMGSLHHSWIITCDGHGFWRLWSRQRELLESIGHTIACPLFQKPMASRLPRRIQSAFTSTSATTMAFCPQSMFRGPEGDIPSTSLPRREV